MKSKSPMTSQTYYKIYVAIEAISTNFKALQSSGRSMDKPVPLLLFDQLPTLIILFMLCNEQSSEWHKKKI